MARYTLKSFYGIKQLERFDHRSPEKLKSILEHPKHHRAGETGPWDEILENADRFEICDSMMEKIFDGNVSDALVFVRGLR